MGTKITDLRFYEARVNLSKPIEDSTHSIPEIKFIILELITDAGAIGQSYMLTFHYSVNAIWGALKDMKDFVINKYDLDQTEKLKIDYVKETEYFGNEGLLLWPLSLINIAIWDAIGNEKNVPIWQLFGGKVKAIPVYGSGGWLSYSLEELVEQALFYKKSGYKSIKVKVGSSDIQQDIERIAKIRDAVGEGIKIMIDANQGLVLDKALELIKSLEPYNIHWFEEPLDHQDFNGYKDLSNNTNVLIAMGEREYNTKLFERLIELNAVNLWQPDIIRIGGVEEWIRSAKIAERNNIPVLPHFYKEYDISLLCTLGNAYAVEYFYWVDSLIDNPIKIVDGYAYQSTSSGWGFRFRKDKISEIKID
jgi:L-alanine-DL-glutamate epimerase-like enolase superfamily enzyme